MDKEEIMEEITRIRDNINHLMTMGYNDWTQNVDDALSEALGDIETALEQFKEDIKSGNGR